MPFLKLAATPLLCSSLLWKSINNPVLAVGLSVKTFDQFDSLPTIYEDEQDGSAVHTSNSDDEVDNNSSDYLQGLADHQHNAALTNGLRVPARTGRAASTNDHANENALPVNEGVLQMGGRLWSLRMHFLISWVCPYVSNTVADKYFGDNGLVIFLISWFLLFSIDLLLRR